MQTIQNSTDQARAEGFTLLRDLFPEDQMQSLITAIERVVTQSEEDDAIRRYEDVFGVRNAFEMVPELSAVTQHQPLVKFLEGYFDGEPFVVKATLFNKTPNTNWGVGWHQDLTIASQEPIETEGFTCWSTKSGIPHVQPPAELLNQMLAVRIHLDDCPADNGALKVIPGSHQQGRLSREQKKSWVDEQEHQICEAHSGDVLIMNPLLLHASAKSTVDLQRRVLHLEVTSQELPGNLDWAQRVRFINIDSEN